MKNRLKQLRKTRQWSQADLARALVISRQAVNGFESGKFTPSLEMAFKIAGLFEIAIEEVFLYREKSKMQMLVENVIQWLPKGERFTVKAIEAIAFAKKQAALSERSQVEPEHIVYGLLNDQTTKVARLLKDCGLTLNIESRDIEHSVASKIDRFSRESQYVLELALQSARLEQRKYIETEDLFWGVLQLAQKGDRDLDDLFKRYEIDVRSLANELNQLNN